MWPSVTAELLEAQERTKNNKGLTLTMAVNYGGRQEIVDAVNQINSKVASGRLKPGLISEKSLAKHLYVPELPDVDLFLRSSGEQRSSNFMIWQSSYAEYLFLPELWPDVTREILWSAVLEYGRRQRRFGQASDAPLN